ncbi:MAG: hypothetical protein KC652_17600 [Cyanobacteria bacterium HKST-UBA01]|nr:hypothetical protein [Cyanobacteria bacterium HKST-UBA01]
MIALPGLIPRISPLSWFVALLAVFGAPVGIALLADLFRAGFVYATSLALLIPSTILVVLLLVTGVKKGIFPWCSEGICGDRFWILQIFILLGGLSIAALVLLTLSNCVCWGDQYRVHSNFFFPKLDTGKMLGLSLFVNCLVGVTGSYPFVGLAQAAIHRRAKRTDWVKSFFAFEVQSLAAISLALICWALLPVFAGFLAICGHPIYFEERQLIRESSAFLIDLTTVPLTFAGILAALASAKNVRIPWSYNFAPLLVAVNFVATLLIVICLCIQSVSPAIFLEFDSLFNYYLGRERRALSSINEAIRIQPADPGLYRQRAEINRSLGERLAAASDYDKCLALGGDFASAFSYLIHYKHAKGELAEAQRLTDLYKDKHPGSADAYILGADLHSSVGEKELARYDYSEGLKRLSYAVYDLDDACYANVRLGNLKEAEHDARLLIKAQPQKSGNHFTLSLVLNNQHRYREAVQAASESIKYYPRNGGSYASRGKAFYRLGEYRKALCDLNRAIELDGDFGKVFYYRSKVYEKLGDKDRAASDLAESKRLGYSTEDNMWF